MEPSIDMQDWELLSESDPSPNLKPYEPIDSEDGAIKPDYFSLDPKAKQQQQQQSEDEIDEDGVDSDNPSWVDPDSDFRFQSSKNCRSFWSDESSEGQRSAADESEVLGAAKEGEVGGGELGKGEVGGGELGKGEVGGGELGKGEDLGSGGERAWWRIPLEILKVWVLRAKPVWSISIAAAIVGVVMLGRRLYKMKQKGRSIPLKLALDDKQASQFMARATRLNEAFSVVKQSPIIRPALSAGGITSWPVTSLR